MAKISNDIEQHALNIYSNQMHILALGSTQPLTEMSTRNVSWGVKAAGA